MDPPMRFKYIECLRMVLTVSQSKAAQWGYHKSSCHRWFLSHLVLGKFGLVLFKACFAKPETEWFGSWQNVKTKTKTGINCLAA